MSTEPISKRLRSTGSKSIPQPQVVITEFSGETSIKLEFEEDEEYLSIFENLCNSANQEPCSEPDPISSDSFLENSADKNLTSLSDFEVSVQQNVTPKSIVNLQLVQTNHNESSIKLSHDLKTTLRCYRCSEEAIPVEQFENHLAERHNVKNTKEGLDIYLKALTDPTTITNLYQCQICHIHFKDIQTLNTHVIRHEYCRLCGYNTTANHIQLHLDVFSHIYQCYLCFHEFTSEHILIQHFAKDHPNAVIKYLKKNHCSENHFCPYCHFSTKSNVVLRLHLTLHSAMGCGVCTLNFLPTALYVQDCNTKMCQKCLDPTKFVRTMLHLQRNISIDSKKTRQSTVLTDLPCLLCDEIMDNGKQLMNHISKFHKYCIPCSKQFNSITLLEAHQDTLHLPNYKCSKCGLFFMSMSNFNDHVNAIHDRKHFSCFTHCTRDMLYDKILSNNKCAYCFTSFKDGSVKNMELHLRTDHKIITCSECSGFMLLKDGFVCATCRSYDAQMAVKCIGTPEIVQAIHNAANTCLEKLKVDSQSTKN